MLELLLCSLFTIFPDYLYRRYQGKRIGKEITIYSVWYEYRYGITTCLMLTIALITIVFYNHPSTSNVTSLYRTISILPEANGRVSEILVGSSADVKKGDPIFRLDSTRQTAALEVATRRIAEIEAAMLMAQADIAAAEGQILKAQGAYEQALEELETKETLQRRNADVVAAREIERLRKLVETRNGDVVAATAARQAAQTRLSTLLPAEKATAEAAREQAQVELSKTVVYAGVSGRIEQFVLRVGDVVNPLMRPAGILIPEGAGQARLIAGFGQIEAQVLRPGMVAEATCMSKPWTIIPMVVTNVQDAVAAGQVRATEQLVEAPQLAKAGTITAFLEPMFPGGMDDVTPGSSCIANAYSNNHDALASKDIGFGRWLYLHIVDAVAVVHAMILRVHAAVLPLKILVFSAH
ncbi:MAG TPA: biotin/lipoyl-binding protein [Hyphomicrobiaceae bacterium]|nr:biotin/lipoyl-binding protein [Hyphomicrobiaceae bacterium]